MRRRANGEGSIVQCGDRWLVFVSKPSGGRIKRTVRTKADAVAIRDKIKAEINGGSYRPSLQTSLGEYVQKWLNEHVTANYASTTAKLWRDHVDLFCGSSDFCVLELLKGGHAVLVEGVTTKQFPTSEEAACPGEYCITGSVFGAIDS